MDDVLAYDDRRVQFTSSSSKILIYSSSIHDISADTNGIGMSFTSPSTTYLGVIRNTLKQLKEITAGKFFGAGFYTSEIGETECRLTCFYRNKIWCGQSFCIQSSTGKTLATDLSISHCPEEQTSAAANGVIYFYLGTMETEILNTNLSNCKLRNIGFYRWQCNGEGKTSFSTTTNNSGRAIFSHFNAYNPTLSFTKMNIVGNERYSTTDELIIKDSATSFTVSDSIFIGNDYAKLSDKEITLIDSLFFECSFDSSPLVTTAATKPLIFAISFIIDWMCITNPPAPSQGFSLRSIPNSLRIGFTLVLISN